MASRLRRISKEMEDTKKDQNAHIILECAEGKNDFTHLHGQFSGPPDTPYEGGTFDIDIKIPNDYPFRPPLCKFTTKVWHPNVSSQTGAICLDTLGTAWSPVLTLKAALQSIQGLLASPEPKDPQDAEVAGMLIKNPDEFARVARQWAQKYAGAPAKGGEGDRASGQAVRVSTPDSARLRQMEEDRKRREQYHGYNPGLVKRFCDMGFEIPVVVSAFEHCVIDRNNGRDYSLGDDQVADVTARLFGEQ